MFFPFSLRFSRRTSWFLRALLTILFIAFVNRGLDREKLTILFGHLSFPHFAVALLFSLGNIYYQVRRWDLILRYEGFTVGRFTSLKTILFGNLLAFVTPGRLGEVFRGVGLEPERKADTVFAVFVDKFFITAATLAAGAACALLQVFLYGVPLNRQFVVVISVGLIISCVGLALLVYRRLPFVPGRVGAYVERALTLAPRVFSRKGAQLVWYSLAGHALLLLQTVLLLHMYGVRDVGGGILAVGQAYAFMVFLPFFIWNLGIREYAFGMVLTQLGVSIAGGVDVAAAALGASVGIFLMNLVLPALGGLLWQYSDGIAKAAISEGQPSSRAGGIGHQRPENKE